LGGLLFFLLIGFVFGFRFSFAKASYFGRNGNHLVRAVQKHAHKYSRDEAHAA
jgi:hypothetical protein